MPSRTQALLFAGAAIAAAAAAAPIAADAQSGLIAGPTQTAPTGRPICLEDNVIDHTQILDDRTILFYIRGGLVLKNTLTDRCVGLKMATRGFTYTALNDQVCGNLQTIRLNDTGQVCALGPFEPYSPAPAQTPAH